MKSNINFIDYFYEAKLYDLFEDINQNMDLNLLKI